MEKRRRFIDRIRWLWERVGDASTLGDVVSWVVGIPAAITLAATMIGPVVGWLTLPVIDLLGVIILALLTGMTALLGLWVVGSVIHSRQVPVLATEPLARQVEGPKPAPIYRATMELGEIACLVAGKPIVAQISSGEELALFKTLRDAANEGRLAMVDPGERGKYAEHSPTTAQNLMDFAAEQEDGKRFSAFASGWSDNTPKRHFKMKLEPGVFRLTGGEIQAAVTSIPLERQISVGEVKLQNFVAKERRLSLFVKGHNASPHRILARDPEGSIGVDDAERRRIENTGRPSLRHLWPDTRAGRPTILGVPAGEGFELVVDARTPERLADDIEAEFAAGRHINLDLMQLELSVVPSDHLDKPVRLDLPESILVRRVGDGFHSVRNIVLGASRIESTSKLFTPNARQNDAEDEGKA